jgi:threonine/homoserine/homoserine lactone efflux protein
MEQAIGQSLPMAVGVALSPIPIIAIILMLATPKARVDGPLFVIGWFVGLMVVGAIGLTLAGAAGASDNGTQSDTTNWVLVAAGVLLILGARKQWRKRPIGDEEPPTPKWMDAIDKFGPGKATVTGFVLSAANPKNLILALAAVASIAATDISGSEQAVAYLVFAVIGTLSVVIPVGIYFFMGDRAAELLNSMKKWMAHNNAVIMTVLFLVIGAKILGQGIGGF